MRKGLIALIATLMFMGAVSSLEGFGIASCQISSGPYTPGAEVPLIKLSINNDDFIPHSILAVTFSYTGTNVNDLNPHRVFFSYDLDGNRTSASDDVFLASAPFSASGTMTGVINLTIPPSTTRYLYLDANLINAPLIDGNTICAQINADGITDDIIFSIDVIYPLKSLNRPSVINITASTATVHDWTTALTAGQTGTAIADAVDPYGNIDLSFTGDSLQLSGYSGYEPGVSAGGFSPVYAGTGAWISADHGRKTLSYTLYKVETGRKLLVQAGLLPTEGVISPEISVTFIAGISALAHDWTTTLTAGQAGTVMVDAVDSSGNIYSDFFGELLQLSGYSGYEPGVSAGGFNPVYMGSCTWSPSDEGRKTLSYTLYKAETGRKLVVESTLLSTGSLVSPEISVTAASRNSYDLEAPASVSGGTEFPAGIAAKDMFGNIDTAFTGGVNITVPDPGRIAPASVTLVNGVWSGNLRLSNDIASPVITITDGSVFSEARGVVGVAVSDSSQAIAYPSVFNPKARPLKIRYNLAANTAVSIKIYDMAGECGKEINCAAGSAGGQAGINIILWDGRDGGGNFGHSGLYKILIDKGYEKQWIKAVIKNY